MKKFRLMMIMSFFVVLFLTGCIKDKTPEKVILRTGDCLKDRGTYKESIDWVRSEYIKQNNSIELKNERFNDLNWQSTITLYAASNNLPDVFQFWSLPAHILPLLQNELLLKLDPKQFADIDFLPGSLEANTYDNALYGIPLTADFWVIFYNRLLFKKAGVALPDSMEMLMESAKRFRTKGIIPITIAGHYAWPLALTFDSIFMQTAGDFKYMKDVLERKIKFTDPLFVKAAQKTQEFLRSDLFDKNIIDLDQEQAEKLFGSQKTAMYITGSWDLNLSNDKKYSTEFQQNIGAFSFPKYRQIQGNATKMVAWFGGNFVIAANSPNKENALKYIKFLTKKFPQQVWKNKGAFPAVKIKETNQEENLLASDLLRALNSTSQTSGTPLNDSADQEFRNKLYDLCIKLASGLVTPEQFCLELEKEAENFHQRRKA